MGRGWTVDTIIAPTHPPTHPPCLLSPPSPPTPPPRWQERFIEAKTSMEDRQARVDAVSEEIEKDLVLLGCTAIEDKLQEGVPQAIKALADADIRLWVLTGDKMVRVGGLLGWGLAGCVDLGVWSVFQPTSANNQPNSSLELGGSEAVEVALQDASPKTRFGLPQTQQKT